MITSRNAARCRGAVHDGAEIPGERAADSGNHTNGSAVMFAVAHRRRRLGRLQPSPKQRPADHSPLAMVNRDASRSFAGRVNGERVRHAEVGHDGSPDSADRQRALPYLRPLARTRRRNRCGRDRNGYRSPLGRDSGHRGTAAPGWGRPDRIGRATDDQRDNSCDTAPACVPRHGVVHAAEARPGSWTSAPCLPPIVGPPRRRHQPPRSRTVIGTGPPPLAADAPRQSTKPWRAIPTANDLRSHAGGETAPVLRGFRPPSTPVNGNQLRMPPRQLSARAVVADVTIGWLSSTQRGPLRPIARLG
jgi:hypothetical protein